MQTALQCPRALFERRSCGGGLSLEATAQLAVVEVQVGSDAAQPAEIQLDADAYVLRVESGPAVVALDIQLQLGVAAVRQREWMAK